MSVPESIATQNQGQVSPSGPRPSLLNRKTMWLLLFVAAVIWALSRSNAFSDEIVNPGGWPLTLRFFRAILRPELSPSFLWLVLDATIATLSFAVAGTALSLLFGLFGGILASEVWWLSLFPQRRTLPAGLRFIWLIIRGVLAFLRAIHEIIWGLFFVNVIGLDPLTAILAIAIPFGAVTSKVFSEILDETPRQPLISLQNSGVSPPKAFLYTLLPQAFRGMLAYGFYRFECSIRAAAVLGIIGAGGLGQEIFLSLQTLKYEQLWTLFFALFLLNGTADYWSALLRRRLGAQINRRPGLRPHLDIIRSNQPHPPTYQRDKVLQRSLIVGLLLIPFSFWYLKPDLGRLFSAQAVEHLTFVTDRAFPLDFATIPLSEWLRLASITMAMSWLATAGAVVIALFLAFPAASNFLLPGGIITGHSSSPLMRLSGTLLLVGTRGLLLVARSIPPPIWALVLLFVLFPGILPGAAALGLYTLGVLGRLMAEVVENLDERPLTAMKSHGATPGQIFAYGVLPATAPQFVAYFLYRWEETIRATVVIGLVGAGGLGLLLIQQLSSFDYQGVLTTLVVFVGLTFAVDMISAVVRRSLRGA